MKNVFKLNGEFQLKEAIANGVRKKKTITNRFKAF